MTSARILGLCGLVASGFVMMSAERPALIVLAGVIMAGANVYALVKG